VLQQWQLLKHFSVNDKYVVSLCKIPIGMSKTFTNLIFITVISLVFANCANRGTPTGGDKDITPPVIIKSIPENYSVNFNVNEIKIYFDEYIKIKNLQKQLIISPPIDPEPEITPFRFSE